MKCIRPPRYLRRYPIHVHWMNTIDRHGDGTFRIHWQPSSWKSWAEVNAKESMRRSEPPPTSGAKCEGGGSTQEIFR